MRIEIRNDLFDIVNRLKEIDEGYGVVFNTDNQKFEVTKNDVTVLVLPFDELDGRTVRHVIYTRSENAVNVLNDIDRENEKLQKDKIKKSMDELEDGISRAFRLHHI